MKELTNRTLYQCDHCGKRYQMKNAAAWHEKHCSMAPENQHICMRDCAHLFVDDTRSEGGSLVFICTALNVQMYGHGAERKRHLEKYPEQFEGAKRMPVECESFKRKF